MNTVIEADMKALFLNAYFYPERIAFSHLEKDLIQGLLEQGLQIQVLCPVPTRGITEIEKKRYASIKKEELWGGVSVWRFWAPQEGRNPLIRAIRYFWCNYRQYWLGRHVTGADVIFAVSTPPTQGLLAGFLSKRLGCRFCYGLQDVFPDSLVTAGLTKKGSLIWKIGRKVEDLTYRYADTIIVISQSMKENILRKGVPEDKIEVISNWIDTDTVKPVPKEENRLFAEYGVDRNVFTVVYAGNFGEAQGAQIVLDTAKALPQVQFVIFGGGSGFERARKQAEILPNVIINELLPQERVPEVYSLGDIALITCKKGAGQSAMPSKTWSIMACETPIVAAFDTDSELAQILRQANAGICVEPENGLALAEAILRMQKEREMFRGGRAYVRANADKAICVEKYVQLLRRKGNQ